MDRLRSIQVFAEVARAQSFTAAARRLSVSRASVTKQIAALEEALGAQLLMRSTQAVGLTDAGRALLESGSSLLEDYDDLEATVRQFVEKPGGTIRIGAPLSFGAFHLVPALAAYIEKNPDVHFSLWADDGTADLIKDGLDLSVRIGFSLRSSSLICRPLARVPQVLVAAPSYLSRHGTPDRPEDLQRHNCLVHVLKSPTDVWRFENPQGAIKVRVQGNIKANMGDALRSAVVRGCGISMHPTYMVHDDIVAGRLKVVLSNYEPERLRIHAVYPQRRHQLPRVRSFLDFMRRWLATDTGWLNPAYPASAVARKTPQGTKDKR